MYLKVEPKSFFYEFINSGDPLYDFLMRRKGERLISLLGKLQKHCVERH